MASSAGRDRLTGCYDIVGLPARTCSNLETDVKVHIPDDVTADAFPVMAS